MRKIQLNVDALAVETFDTAQTDPAEAGTVRGHAFTAPTPGCPNISRGTCFQSCAMTNGYQVCIEPHC